MANADERGLTWSAGAGPTGCMARPPARLLRWALARPWRLPRPWRQSVTAGKDRPDGQGEASGEVPEKGPETSSHGPFDEPLVNRVLRLGVVVCWLMTYCWLYVGGRLAGFQVETLQAATAALFITGLHVLMATLVWLLVVLLRKVDE